MSEINLKPIGTNPIFDYESNKIIDLKKYSIGDFDLGVDGIPPHTGFALRMCNDKREGYFVEIGAGHWQHGNNTYALEKYFDWKGVAIEIRENVAEEYNKNRLNKCVTGDAFTYNWDKHFEENNFPNRIDYLQIDVDKTPEYANLLALINMPLSRYRFNTITLEHCANMDPRLYKVRDMQREILFSYGYRIVAAGFDEDWWIDSKIGISESEYNEITYKTWKGDFI